MLKINFYSLFFFTVLFLNSLNVLCSSFRQAEQSSFPSIQESFVSVPSLFPIESSATPELHNWHFNSSTHTFIPIGWDPNNSTSTFANTNHFSLPITHYIEDFSDACANTNNSFPSLIPDESILGNTMDNSANTNNKLNASVVSDTKWQEVAHTSEDKGHASSEKKKKKPTKKTYTCPKCNKTLARQDSLNYHIKTHDPNREKPFKCHICQKSFAKKSNRKSHTRTHTGEKPFKCHICHRGLSSKISLKNHLKKHRGKKPYTCEKCQKNFWKKHSLKEHIKLHKAKKSYKCDQCTKAYSSKGALRRHMEAHDRPKPYTCYYCNADFALKSKYKNHMDYHEETDEDRKCHICQKVYSDKYHLTRHNKRVHPRIES